MINEKDNIEPGQVKFLETAPPPMTAGAYTINTRQEVAAAGATPFEKIDTGFYIAAPRFALALSDVYNIYPAPGSVGSYYKTLPHVVFSRKTLPWERAINSKAPDITPWMCLLVLDEDEIKQNDIAIKNKKLSEIVDSSDAAVIIPELVLDPWEEAEKAQTGNDVPMYATVDMPYPLFAKLVPYENELPLLAHARQVDTGNKEMAGINAKGWFSLLMANRIPTKNKNNTVLLVSLEGHDIKKETLTNAGNAGKKIRLVVFHNWIFNASGLDFEALVNKLNKNIAPLSIDSSNATNSTVKKALSFGYIPMNMQMRNGEKNVARYRGPLTPVTVPRPPVFRYTNADAALRYDTDTDMFDASYAAAWQLGRLMGLRAENFVKALKGWKAGFEKNALTALSVNLLKNQFPGMVLPGDETAQDKAELQELMHKIETDEILKGFIMEIWNRMQDADGKNE